MKRLIRSEATGASAARGARKASCGGGAHKLAAAQRVLEAFQRGWHSDGGGAILDNEP